jgi:hypothetical protein
MEAFSGKRVRIVSSFIRPVQGGSMRRIFAWLVISGWICAPLPAQTLPNPGATTAKLYARWVQSADQVAAGDQRTNPLYRQLLEMPDADLVFFQGAYGPSGNWARILCEESLAVKNTDRTFAAAVQRLDDARLPYQRVRAVEVYGLFPRPMVVTKSMQILANDPDVLIRERAAHALTHHPGNTVEQALLHALGRQENRTIDPAIAGFLGKLNCAAAVQPIAHLLKAESDSQKRDWYRNALRRIHRKAVVPILIDEYADLISKKPATGTVESFYADELRTTLAIYANLTTRRFGPLPDTLEQWRDWWTQAGPLFDEWMELKHPFAPPPPPPHYPPEAFIQAPEKIDLSISLDAHTYRTGEPVRLEMEMVNEAHAPQRALPAHLPSSWWAVMGFGVTLKRDGRTILEFSPSSPSTMISYAAPTFQTMPPGHPFRSTVCLQHWLSEEPGGLELPLPEGSYELKIVFDSSTFPGLKAKGKEVLGRWETKPVRFTVSGPPRTQANEILAVIARKADIRWLQTDLTSRVPERRRRAWKAVEDYGDSRLEAFVKKIEAEKPDSVEYIRNSDSLWPYEHHSDSGR